MCTHVLPQARTCKVDVDAPVCLETETMRSWHWFSLVAKQKTISLEF